MIKLICSIVLILTIFITAGPVLADPISDVFGKVKPPQAVSGLGTGKEGIEKFIGLAIQLIYITAAVAFVFMVLISAFQWIVSGGDKDAVAGARKRLTYAIIGIVVLSLAFVIIRIVGQITGFEFFVGQNNPT